MLITVVSHKGGVGKTTTAFHVAAYLQIKNGPALLVDGDPNRSALRWSKRGSPPFTCIDAQELGGWLMDNPRPAHIVTDTQARPSPEDLEYLAKRCDLLVLPTTPDPLAMDTLSAMLGDLKKLGSVCPYKVLLTCVPPAPNPQGAGARAYLESGSQPIFKRHIRRYAAYAEATAIGTTVHGTTSRYGKIAWSDYEAVGQEILEGSDHAR